MSFHYRTLYSQHHLLLRRSDILLSSLPRRDLSSIAIDTINLLAMLERLCLSSNRSLVESATNLCGKANVSIYSYF